VKRPKNADPRKESVGSIVLLGQFGRHGLALECGVGREMYASNPGTGTEA